MTDQFHALSHPQKNAIARYLMLRRRIRQLKERFVFAALITAGSYLVMTGLRSSVDIGLAEQVMNWVLCISAVLSLATFGLLHFGERRVRAELRSRGIPPDLVHTLSMMDLARIFKSE